MDAGGNFTPNKAGNTIRVEFPEDTMSQVRGKWVRLSFKVTLKHEYRSNPEALKTLGWISDEVDKKGTLALPEWAEDLNTYLNYGNSSGSATGDRILRLIQTGGRYYAQTEQGQYFQKNVNGDGDGHWYKTTLHPDNSSLTGLWKVTNTGLESPLPAGGQYEKDGKGVDLNGNNNTVNLFNNSTHFA